MNYKKRKFNKIYIYLSLLIVIIFILFYFFINDKSKENFVLNSLKDLTASLSNITSFSFMKDTKSYNSELINEINNDYIKEINNLKEELNLNKLNSDKKYINATVIKRSNNYWYNIITIDKGKNENIKKGEAVINNQGLVGKVLKVNNNSSDIKLLSSLNEENYISARFSYENKDYYGLITSYDYKSNTLNMKYVIGNFNIYKIKNENVMTTGLNDSFSSGLLIGKIAEIKKDKFGLSYDIKITPTVNYNNLNIVTVIVGDK